MFLNNCVNVFRRFRSHNLKFKVLTRFKSMDELAEGGPPEFLEVDPSNRARRVAYRRITGHKSPGVIYLPGYMSNMNSTKALRLASLCEETGHSLVRFDYESIGESPGNFEDVTFDVWKSDVLAVLDKLTSGPQVLVGSSMGAWFMLQVALERLERINGLIGCGSAINFTGTYYDRFPQEVKDKLQSGELVTINGLYGEYLATKKFMDSFNASYIFTDRPLQIDCPIRLIHAIDDESSPLESAMLIAKLVRSKDVNIIVRKDSDHRVSDPDSLKALDNALIEMLSQPLDLKET